MSIRTLMQPENKGWLNIKANTLDSLTTNVLNGDVINFPVGSSITLSGSTGSIGQMIKKSGGNVVWINDNEIGDEFTSTNDNTVFNTSSAVYVTIPNSQFTTPNLPLGTYILLYSAEIQTTPTADAKIKAIDLDLVADINLWNLITGSSNLPQRITGMYFTTISGIKNYEFQIQTPSAIQVGSRNVRWILFRLS
jgi:hypothetical protein